MLLPRTVSAAQCTSGRAGAREGARKATAEPVRFEATADVDDAVKESHEGNNVVRLNFAGGHLPDLVIESVTYSLAEPSFGQLLTVTVTVANRGSGRVGASRTVVSLAPRAPRPSPSPG